MQKFTLLIPVVLYLFLWSCNSEGGGSNATQAPTEASPSESKPDAGSEEAPPRKNEALEIPPHKGELLPGDDPTWTAALAAHVRPLQARFNEMEKGMGERKDEGGEFLRIDVGADRQPEVLALYRIAFEHSRGSAYPWACVVWDEASGKALGPELEIAESEAVVFLGTDGDWLRFEDLDPYVAAKRFIWCQIEGHKTFKTADPNERPPQAPQVQVVAQDNGASDIYWELQTPDGKAFSLPKEVEAELRKAIHPPILTPGNWYALYLIDHYLVSLDLIEKDNDYLITLYQGIDGLSPLLPCPDQANRFAFANLNFERYSEKGKLFLIDLVDGHTQTRQKFNAPFHYGPKGNSIYHLIEAGKDFYFEDANTLVYRIDPMVVDPDLTFGEWGPDYDFELERIGLK